MPVGQMRPYCSHHVCVWPFAWLAAPLPRAPGAESEPLLPTSPAWQRTGLPKRRTLLPPPQPPRRPSTTRQPLDSCLCSRDSCPVTPPPRGHSRAPRLSSTVCVLRSPEGQQDERQSGCPPQSWSSPFLQTQLRQRHRPGGAPRGGLFRGGSRGSLEKSGRGSVEVPLTDHQRSLQTAVLAGPAGERFPGPQQMTPHQRSGGTVTRPRLDHSGEGCQVPRVLRAD